MSSSNTISPNNDPFYWIDRFASLGGEVGDLVQNGLNQKKQEELRKVAWENLPKLGGMIAATAGGLLIKKNPYGLIGSLVMPMVWGTLTGTGTQVALTGLLHGFDQKSFGDVLVSSANDAFGASMSISIARGVTMALGALGVTSHIARGIAVNEAIGAAHALKNWDTTYGIEDVIISGMTGALGGAWAPLLQNRVAAELFCEINREFGENILQAKFDRFSDGDLTIKNVTESFVLSFAELGGSIKGHRGGLDPDNIEDPQSRSRESGRSITPSRSLLAQAGTVGMTGFIGALLLHPSSLQASVDGTVVVAGMAWISWLLGGSLGTAIRAGLSHYHRPPAEMVEESTVSPPAPETGLNKTVDFKVVREQAFDGIDYQREARKRARVYPRETIARRLGEIDLVTMCVRNNIRGDFTFATDFTDIEMLGPNFYDGVGPTLSKRAAIRFRVEEIKGDLRVCLVDYNQGDANVDEVLGAFAQNKSIHWKASRKYLGIVRIQRVITCGVERRILRWLGPLATDYQGNYYLRNWFITFLSNPFHVTSIATVSALDALKEGESISIGLSGYIQKSHIYHVTIDPPGKAKNTKNTRVNLSLQKLSDNQVGIAVSDIELDVYHDAVPPDLLFALGKNWALDLSNLPPPLREEVRFETVKSIIFEDHLKLERSREGWNIANLTRDELLNLLRTLNLEQRLAINPFLRTTITEPTEFVLTGILGKTEVRRLGFFRASPDGSWPMNDQYFQVRVRIIPAEGETFRVEYPEATGNVHRPPFEALTSPSFGRQATIDNLREQRDAFFAEAAHHTSSPRQILVATAALPGGLAPDGVTIAGGLMVMTREQYQAFMVGRNPADHPAIIILRNGNQSPWQLLDAVGPGGRRIAEACVEAKWFEDDLSDTAGLQRFTSLRNEHVYEGAEKYTDHLLGRLQDMGWPYLRDHLEERAKEANTRRLYIVSHGWGGTGGLRVLTPEEFSDWPKRDDRKWPHVEIIMDEKNNWHAIRTGNENAMAIFNTFNRLGWIGDALFNGPGAQNVTREMVVALGVEDPLTEFIRIRTCLTQSDFIKADLAATERYLTEAFGKTDLQEAIFQMLAIKGITGRCYMVSHASTGAGGILFLTEAEYESWPNKVQKHFPAICYERNAPASWRAAYKHGDASTLLLAATIQAELFTTDPRVLPYEAPLTPAGEALITCIVGRPLGLVAADGKAHTLFDKALEEKKFQQGKFVKYPCELVVVGRQKGFRDGDLLLPLRIMTMTEYARWCAFIGERNIKEYPRLFLSQLTETDPWELIEAKGANSTAFEEAFIVTQWLTDPLGRTKDHFDLKRQTFNATIAGLREQKNELGQLFGRVVRQVAKDLGVRRSRRIVAVVAGKAGIEDAREGVVLDQGLEVLALDQLDHRFKSTQIAKYPRVYLVEDLVTGDYHVGTILGTGGQALCDFLLELDWIKPGRTEDRLIATTNFPSDRTTDNPLFNLFVRHGLRTPFLEYCKQIGGDTHTTLYVATNGPFAEDGLLVLTPQQYEEWRLWHPREGSAIEIRRVPGTQNWKTTSIQGEDAKAILSALHTTRCLVETEQRIVNRRRFNDHNEFGRPCYNLATDAYLRNYLTSSLQRAFQENGGHPVYVAIRGESQVDGFRVETDRTHLIEGEAYFVINAVGPNHNPGVVKACGVLAEAHLVSFIEQGWFMDVTGTWEGKITGRSLDEIFTDQQGVRLVRERLGENLESQGGWVRVGQTIEDRGNGLRIGGRESNVDEYVEVRRSANGDPAEIRWYRSVARGARGEEILEHLLTQGIIQDPPNFKEATIGLLIDDLKDPFVSRKLRENLERASGPIDSGRDVVILTAANNGLQNVRVREQWKRDHDTYRIGDSGLTLTTMQGYVDWIEGKGRFTINRLEEFLAWASTRGESLIGTRPMVVLYRKPPTEKNYKLDPIGTWLMIRYRNRDSALVEALDQTGVVKKPISPKGKKKKEEDK